MAVTRTARTTIPIETADVEIKDITITTTVIITEEEEEGIGREEVEEDLMAQIEDTMISIIQTLLNSAKRIKLGMTSEMFYSRLVRRIISIVSQIYSLWQIGFKTLGMKVS